MHPVDPLIDPKPSSHGSVDVAFDEFPLDSEPCLLGTLKTATKNSPQAPRQWKETTAEHEISALEAQTLDTYP